jgi:hemerythrin-like metal-binding protein
MNIQCDLIEWSEAMSVMVDSIDREHRAIISLCNELIKAAASQHHHEALHPLLEEIEQTILLHFLNEESILKVLTGQEVEYHIALHDGARTQLKKLMGVAPNEFDAGVALSFFRTWICHHIANEDRMVFDILLSIKGGMKAR